MTRSAPRLTSLILSGVFLAASPCPGQFLELTVEPEVGTLDQEFTFTLTNRGPGPASYDGCCAFPQITSIAEGRTLPPCPVCGCPAGFFDVLPSGGSLEHRWRPQDSACDWIPAPGLFEVRWSGFLDHWSARFEILPDPARTLELSVDPPVGRYGEPVAIVMRNSTPGDLCLEPAREYLRGLNPLGEAVLCAGGALCGPAACCGVLPPGEAGPTLVWTPGVSGTCRGDWVPGRHRLIWTGMDPDRERWYGEAEVLLLPALDRRLELELSASQVRMGERLTITATNSLDVPVWHDPCCDEPLFLDEVGSSPCRPCVEDCISRRVREILPGQSISMEVSVPGNGVCGFKPGRWSVLWGRNFGLVPGGEPAPPVFGYAELEVLPGQEQGFRRGDCNGGGMVDVSDAIALLEHLFLGGDKPACPDACDTDDSGDLLINDAIGILSYLFLGGPAPEPPFPDPGPDSTADELTCNA